MTALCGYKALSNDKTGVTWELAVAKVCLY